MRVYDAKNIKYKDGLAEKRRRVFVLKALFSISLSIVIIGLIVYLLFFSGLLEIREVSVNGLEKVNGTDFHNELNKRLDSKWRGLFKHQKNVLFFNSDIFKAEALAAFPEIKDISINKKPPNALDIDVMERVAAGIWCFTDSSIHSTNSEQAGVTKNCKYFDKEGAVWGEAAKSSGFLILVVEDMRQDAQDMIRPIRPVQGKQDSPQIDRDLLASMMLVFKWLKEKDIFIKKFTVPDNFIGDFSAFTSGGYELMFNIDSDIEEQLEVLEIFLMEKRSESSLPALPIGEWWSRFKPQYIDLRINGRIYYK